MPFYRGAGLFVGVELVEDRKLRTPATKAAAQVVKRYNGKMHHAKTTSAFTLLRLKSGGKIVAAPENHSRELLNVVIPNRQGKSPKTKHLFHFLFTLVPLKAYHVPNRNHGLLINTF